MKLEFEQKQRILKIAMAASYFSHMYGYARANVDNLKGRVSDGALKKMIHQEDIFRRSRQRMNDLLTKELLSL